VTPAADFRRLLWTAEQLPGAPRVADPGGVLAAGRRTGAQVFGREAYGPLLLKAAALCQALALLAPLDHGNAPFGFVAARAFLAAHGVPLHPDRAGLARFLASLAPGRAGLEAIAHQLARWAADPAGRAPGR
jgi:prophage maintenance system killer protein